MAMLSLSFLLPVPKFNKVGGENCYTNVSYMAGHFDNRNIFSVLPKLYVTQTESV